MKVGELSQVSSCEKLESAQFLIVLFNPCVDIKNDRSNVSPAPTASAWYLHLLDSLPSPNNVGHQTTWTESLSDSGQLQYHEN